MNDFRPPRPRAFRLDDISVSLDDAPARVPSPVQIKSQNFPTFDAGKITSDKSADRDEQATQAAQQRGILARWRPSLGGLIGSAVGGLLSMAIGLWITQLIEGLFAQATALGWVSVGLAGLLLIGLGAFLAREIIAIARQSRIAQLHRDLALAREKDDRDAARAGLARLAALYADRAQTARARAEISDASQSIIDGRDLIDIAERLLLRPLDLQAQSEIAAAAKRVSLVTAISPRAILDVIFVAAQIIRLVRTIAQIYGGRPGLLGFIKLARSIGAHLAITGGLAVGDSLLQQLVGHGIASKISARMGEGVLNGLLTARVGLSTLSVCRPAPFIVHRPPGVADVAPFLFGAGERS